jgi:L-fucose dehydrogenase
MDLRIRDKVVLITDGAKGIGAAIARGCANEGAIPVLVALEIAPSRAK